MAVAAAPCEERDGRCEDWWPPLSESTAGVRWPALSVLPLLLVDGAFGSRKSRNLAARSFEPVARAVRLSLRGAGPGEGGRDRGPPRTRLRPSAGFEKRSPRDRVLSAGWMLASRCRRSLTFGAVWGTPTYLQTTGAISGTALELGRLRVSPPRWRRSGKRQRQNPAVAVHVDGPRDPLAGDR